MEVSQNSHVTNCCCFGLTHPPESSTTSESSLVAPDSSSSSSSVCSLDCSKESPFPSISIASLALSFSENNEDVLGEGGGGPSATITGDVWVWKIQQHQVL